MRAATRDIETPQGRAVVHLHLAGEPSRALVLGHGAGGGVDAPDLTAVHDVAVAAGVRVALVTQPYRVAGRRAPAPAGQLDEAWTAVVSEIRVDGLPLVVGGRSSGARVACRTAADTGAAGVICLAFPLHPPGRANDPEKSRLPELEAVSVPVLVVQGDRDPFGMPPGGPGRTVVRIPGNHSLRQPAAVRSAVEPWLAALLTNFTITNPTPAHSPDASD